ncbi:uncharacterized protein LOC128217180 isoform X2 [Mya arenaria]|uniref:uncharacterized protein LOC128217180 isoform X2 n=1 Tax=Mya arenaria TaxID=6604 RepID=UPI0022DEEAF0|nr:uncharacterized protein LOC128217180 isoform X2 [Mya arenaria]
MLSVMTRSLALLLVVVATVYAAPPVRIDSKDECGSTNTVELDSDFRLVGRGVAAGANSTKDSMCTFSFTATDGAEGCMGLCYMFDHYATINDMKVELAVGPKVFKKGDAFPMEPVCMEDKALPVTLTQKTGYIYKKDEPNYKFVLSVYNKCGMKGSVINIDFDEAIQLVDGYHHGEKKEDRERSTFIAGILLGFGLSCIFLVVLAIGYCYTRNSPTGRGRSSSAMKIGGQRGKMTPGQEPKEVEMGVRYKAKDPDQPEVKPLLDPVKPPAEGATGKHSA